MQGRLSDASTIERTSASMGPWSDTGTLRFHGKRINEWLQNQRIDESIHSIDFSGSDICDDDLRLLSRAKLRIVAIERTAVTDNGLSALASQRTISSLHLTDCDVSNEGVAELLMNNPVSVVSLSGTSIDPSILANISSPKSVVFLELARTRITDLGLASLTQMTNLHYLDLSDTIITDDTATVLSKMPWLRSVDVSRTRVTKRGIEGLATIKGIELKKLDD